MFRLWGRQAAALGALLLLTPATAQAAQNAACDAHIRLRADGRAEVSGAFSGLPSGLATLDLFTGAKDTGVLKLAVAEGAAQFSYSSAHQLHSGQDGLYLGSPDFYVPGAGLDLTLSVQFPPQYVLQDAQPEPADRGLGSLRWEESSVSHFVAVLHFAPREGAVAPGGEPAGADTSAAADASGEQAAPASHIPPVAPHSVAADGLPPAQKPEPPPGPPGKLFDPAELPPLRPGDEAQSAQQLLEELAFAIKLARAEDQSDPGFLDALEKFLAKLYAYFKGQGLEK